MGYGRGRPEADLDRSPYRTSNRGKSTFGQIKGHPAATPNQPFEVSPLTEHSPHY
jgi:hypothetical protein